MRGREKEKQIERLPTGNEKSTLEEDGLKMSVCSFLNVKSFSNRETGVRDRHFFSAAQNNISF